MERPEAVPQDYIYVSDYEHANGGTGAWLPPSHDHFAAVKASESKPTDTQEPPAAEEKKTETETAAEARARKRKSRWGAEVEGGTK